MKADKKMKKKSSTKNHWGYFSNGKFLTDGEVLEVRSCFENELVATACRPSREALEESIRSASEAGRKVAGMPLFERAEILRSMSTVVESRREEFVRILALEAGKPVKAGRVEVDRCIFNLRNASEETQRIGHELIPLDLLPAAANRWGMIRRFPLGTLLAITPFNFPLNLVAHKIGPAFGAGNSVVQKPASKTPICSLMLAEIANDCGMPPGALNVLPCSGPEAEAMVQDDRFNMLTFTGSSEVGWRLKSISGHKKVALELGGNAGVIVHDDADLEDAAKRCALGGFAYAGQSCISVQRVFVQKSVFKDFKKFLVKETEKLNVGDPLDETTDVGPMISKQDAKRIEEWVDEAVQLGAEILTGGKRKGIFYRPTVLTRTKPGMRVNCQEVFGPIVTLESYLTIDEALKTVNNSEFGLQAGIFTNNNHLIFRAFEELEVGGVVANDVPTFRADHMPYGGMKGSGMGREGARYALEEMTERKILVLNLGV
jgi:glyceraldehyde-3-phosphate dehydrogenase (NADP+)